MSKLIWGVGSLAVLSAAVVGGNLYADKNLNAYYENSQLSDVVEDIDIQYSHYKMGLMDGSVDWKLTLKPDPCNPKEVIVIHGHDDIKRGFKGYTVLSNFKIVKDQSHGKFANVIQGNISANTLVNWIGQTTTDVQIPAFKTVAETKKIHANASKLKIKTFSRPGQLTQVTEFSMIFPVVQVLDGTEQTMIQDLVLTTNQGLNKPQLESGFVEMQAASFKRIDSKMSGGMKGLDMRWETKINPNDVDFIGYIKASEMDFPGSPITQNLALNLELNKVNLQKVKAFRDVWHQVDNSCDAVTDSGPEMTKAFLAVVNQGFDFKSKNNTISLGGGSASASLDGKLMPGHQASIESFVKMVPSLLDFHADLKFDKNMLSAVMNNYLQLQGKSISGQEVESMFSSLESSGQGKRDGNDMVVSMQYKFGQKLFGKAVQQKD